MAVRHTGASVRHASVYGSSAPKSVDPAPGPPTYVRAHPSVEVGANYYRLLYSTSLATFISDPCAMIA